MEDLTNQFTIFRDKSDCVEMVVCDRISELFIDSCEDVLDRDTHDAVAFYLYLPR